MGAALQFWIGVVSREHILFGVRGGFLQLNHGKKAPVQRLGAGDGVAIYSPRTTYPDGEPLQCFTAIGTVKSGRVYPVEMSDDFKPYRIDVQYFPCREASIRPLIEQLSFITDKTRWGGAFRYGYVKVPAADFIVIARAMNAESQSFEHAL
jgi:EVE domain-containing protein